MSRIDVVDYLCGEGSAAEREEFRQRVARDIGLAVELAETKALFEGLRGLSCEESPNATVALRAAVVRRADLRHLDAERLGFFATAWRVAAVAVLTLGAGWLAFGRSALAPQEAPPPALIAVEERPWATTSERAPRVTVDEELEGLLDRSHSPVAAEAFLQNLALIDAATIDTATNDTATNDTGTNDTGAVPDGFSGWLTAENRLAQVRREYSLRYSEEARARARRVLGTPDLDGRIEALAAELAPRLSPPDTASLDELVLGVRALLAAGSTLDAGRFRETIRACTDELVDRVPQLHDDELALGLAALTDVAVVAGGEYGNLVGEHAERLARNVLRPGEAGRRPALLHWATPAARIADAGRVLQLAPAFGTHAGVAFRARTMLAAHLGERLDRRTGAESPALIAASLYGFSDLIDRREADRRLTLWRARMLLFDYVALHQLAWSKYPVRRGWAEFQLELRGFAGLPTPASTSDLAALLLTLSTNVAAPGVLDGLRLADL